MTGREPESPREEVERSVDPPPRSVREPEPVERPNPTRRVIESETEDDDG